MDWEWKMSELLGGCVGEADLRLLLAAGVVNSRCSPEFSESNWGKVWVYMRSETFIYIFSLS